MNNLHYSQDYALQKDEIDNRKKLEEFKERISKFADVTTLSEAKELAEKIIPTSMEYTNFFIGNAKCIVFNSDTTLRISIDSADEYLCYDFN